MSKRYAFTTTTRLPASVTRDAVLNYLQNHEGFLACNPLVTQWRRIAPPAGAHPDEQKCAWFSVTEKSHSALPGRIGDDTTHECSFYNLPDGILTHVWATMGVDIRQRWIVEGALPGEPAQQPRSRLDAPSTGLHLREDVEMRCNVLMASSLKKSLRGSHAAHVKRLCEQAWLAPRPSRPRSTTTTTTMTMAYSKTPPPGLYAHELRPNLASSRPLSHSTSDPETYTTPRNPNHNRWASSRDSSPGMTRGTRARLSLPPITTQFGPPSPAPPPVPLETTRSSSDNNNNDNDNDGSLYPHPLRIARHVSPAAHHPQPSHRHSSAPALVAPPPPTPPCYQGTALDPSRGTSTAATMKTNRHLAPPSLETAGRAAPAASSSSSSSPSQHLNPRGAETAKQTATRRPTPSPRSTGSGGLLAGVNRRQAGTGPDQQKQQQQQQQQSQRATMTTTTIQHPLYPMLNPYSDEGLSPIVLTEDQRAAILRDISDTLSAVREAQQEEPPRLTSATLNAPFAPEFYENFCLV